MDRFVAQLIKQMVEAAKSMLGWPYEMGGWGKPPDYGIDCRGHAQVSFKLAGARALIGGYQMNVRHMVKWAKENGRFRDPATYTGKRGDLIFYYEPDAPPTPGNPDRIRHVAIELQPVGKHWPAGRAISAVNPRWDVTYHELLMHDLGIRNLAILGYCEPDWASLEVDEPAMVDPEPVI